MYSWRSTNPQRDEILREHIARNSTATNDSISLRSTIDHPQIFYPYETILITCQHYLTPTQTLFPLPPLPNKIHASTKDYPTNFRQQFNQPCSPRIRIDSNKTLPTSRRSPLMTVFQPLRRKLSRPWYLIIVPFYISFARRRWFWFFFSVIFPDS